MPTPLAVITPFETDATAASAVEYLTVAEEGVFFTVSFVFSPTLSFVAPTFAVNVGFLTVTVAFKVLETFFPAFLAVTFNFI